VTTETVEAEHVRPVLVKTERVVGEAVREITVETQVGLDVPARQIVNIEARVVNLQAEVAEGAVVITGTLHKQIFFVELDPEARVRHHAEPVPFATSVTVPGAEPGMNVQVFPRVVDVEFELVNATRVRQAVVIQFFVKVHETAQLTVVTTDDPRKPLFKIERVLGEDVVPVVEVSPIELPLPAIKVRAVEVRVMDVEHQVVPGAVIVTGTLRKKVFFVGVDDIERAFEVEVPFTATAEIAEAEPGVQVQVQVTVGQVFVQLVGPTPTTQAIQRAALQVFVKVGRSEQFRLIEDTRGPLIKTERVIAEATRQVLVEHLKVFDMPARKVRNIDARVTVDRTEILPRKIVVQGVLDKQIFFVGSDDVVHHQREEVPFSTFVELPVRIEPRPGVEAQVTARVEFVDFRLLRPEEIPVPVPPLPCDRDPYVDPCVDDLFAGLMQKVILELFVKVGEVVQVRVRTVVRDP